MSDTVITKLRQERDQARDQAIALAESEDFNPESDAFKQYEARSASLDLQIAAIARNEQAREAADALDGKMSKAVTQRAQAQAQPPQTRQSLGELFVRSEQFENYRFKGNSGVFTIPDDDLQTRALPTSMATLVAAGLTGPKYRVDTSAPTAPAPLLATVTQVQVSGNAIEYVAWAKSAGSAATVAEGSAKPSVEFAPAVTAGTLDMIAGYTQLTRQMIEDYPAVRSLIDTELVREITREEEEHAAAALVAATIPTATATAALGGLLAAIRKGIGTVQAAGYNPNAVLLNPADYAALDVDVMGATLLGPVIRQSFWGLTVTAASSQPAGTATVGDFRAGVQHFFRSAINLFVTDSHADTFLTNVFTLLAERRSKTVVVRPSALVECSGIP